MLVTVSNNIRKLQKKQFAIKQEKQKKRAIPPPPPYILCITLSTKELIFYIKSHLPALKRSLRIFYATTQCRRQRTRILFFSGIKDYHYFPSLWDCKNSWWADGEFGFHAPGNLKKAAKILHKSLKLDNVSWVTKSFYSRIRRDKMKTLYFVDFQSSR